MKKRMIIAILMAVLIAGIIMAIGWKSESRTITISGVSGDHAFNAEISDNPISMERGLMFRKSLDEDKGMLFVWKDEGPRSFWMKDTLIPLDMIFINEDMEIVGINRNAQPCGNEECIPYDSMKPAMYALEINGGLSDRFNISIGDKVF